MYHTVSAVLEKIAMIYTGAYFVTLRKKISFLLDKEVTEIVVLPQQPRKSGFSNFWRHCGAFWFQRAGWRRYTAR